MSRRSSLHQDIIDRGRVGRESWEDNQGRKRNGWMEGSLVSDLEEEFDKALHSFPVPDLNFCIRKIIDDFHTAKIIGSVIRKNGGGEEGLL
ncbi:hypothetical protein RRG08_058461 [Elysia crispata]|uniref:Uncharacterized protein n=1 Tax=Elysia crispata TaxID=231223 RepID=A0AAE0Y620_9GAST|nr:hypothetical protein RRG08_058461 [Elysia crispata]